jgi:hypothetical protein
MEFKEMKKEELVKLLEEQRHLAQAVDAKDAEIISILKEKETTISKITETKNSEIATLSKQYAEFKEKNIKEKNELSNKISELQNKINSTPSIERYEESIKKLEEENKKLVSFANQYINVFKNTLKALQGNLDNAIELQDILVNGVKEK